MREKYWFESYMFLLILISDIDFTSSLKNKHRPATHHCVQDGPCKCVFSNGSEVDILGLNSQDFSWVNLNESIAVSYHPCRDEKIIVTDAVKDDCSSGVSICLRINESTPNKFSYLNLGKTSEGQFSSNTDGPLSIVFSKRNSSVLLICDQNSNPPRLSPRLENDLYILELISPYSCLKDSDVEPGLSTGSMLVLLFFLLSFVYFGGGMLTLKLLRGAEGKEMIPNYEFWADLPYLVRDGILFTLSGFQASPSYDRI